MENYKEELLKIKEELGKLQQFSLFNIKTFEKLLDRYDALIKELIRTSNMEFQVSIRIIQFVRQKMPIIKSKGMIIVIKRNTFVKARRTLLRSIERDLGI